MSNLRCEMIDAGLLIGTGVDGVVGRGAVFDDVVSRVDRVIARWQSGGKAVPRRFIFRR